MSRINGSSKATKGSGLSQNSSKKILQERQNFGYRPTGPRTSENSVPPDCGTSVKNIAEQK